MSILDKFGYSSSTLSPAIRWTYFKLSISIFSSEFTDPRGFPALQVYFFFCATARASDVHLGLEVSASLLLLYWQHEGPVLATCVRERTETVSSLINSSQLVLCSTVLKRLECSVGGSTMMLYFGCYFTTLLMCLWTVLLSIVFVK